MLSSLLIGSHPNVPEATFDVDVGGTVESLSIAAGAYYLADTDSSLSLVDAFAAAIQEHSSLSSVSAWVGEDQTVHVQADTAFDLTWTGDTTARNLLGITGDWGTSQTDQDAQSVSPLLWMPGHTESPTMARLGVNGKPVWDTKVGMPGTAARVTATQHNLVYHNEFEWRYVENDRVWTTSPANGEFYKFFDQVLRRFYKFKLYRERTDDSTSTTDVGISSTGQLGPYIMRHSGGKVQWDYELEEANVHRLHPITLPVVVVSEYT